MSKLLLLLLSICVMKCITGTLENARILQDNPSNPTGPNMGTIPGIVPLTLQALTPSIVNAIAQLTGQSTAGNYQLIGPNVSQTINITIPQTPNISIQIVGVGGLTNVTWVPVSVQSLTQNAQWIAARGLLLRSNLSYSSENQIILLSRQANTFNTNFNVTYISVRGYIEAIITISPTLTASLASLKYLQSASTPVNARAPFYLVIESLLKNVFYDFLKAPVSLLNGTATNVSSVTIYNLNYQSAAGIYGFTVKVQNRKMYIIGCNLISVKVGTQTVPVLTNQNLLNVDGNFEFVNSTLKNFLQSNDLGNIVQYQKTVLWVNRAGNLLIYYLTLAVGTSNIEIGINFNITSRSATVSYFRNNSASPVTTINNNFIEATYLSQANNQTFLAVDLAARTNFPTVVVGPVTKIQTKTGEKGADYRITYLGSLSPVVVEYQS